MFTVAWTQSASEQLADAWVKSDSNVRDEITKYVQHLDRHLRFHADRLGESREPGVRVLTDAPLGIEPIRKPSEERGTGTFCSEDSTK